MDAHGREDKPRGALPEASTKMIVIQQLTTTWEKPSRGAEGARRRAIPDALLLPHAAVVADDVFVHTVVFNHDHGYDPRSSFRELRLRRLLDELPALQIDHRPDHLVVKYAWSPRLGAPARPSGPRHRLAKGCWCRIRSNGRLAYEGSWGYRDVVFNIAYQPHDEHVFRAMAPAFEEDHRKDLW